MREVLPRFLLGLLVVGALVGVGFAFTLNEDPEEALAFPTEIESLTPAPDSPVVPSQSTIAADLAFGYEAVLLLNGVELPLDQLNRKQMASLGFVSWSPGPGQEVRRLAPGRQCAGVVYWPQGGAQATDGKRYEWCFNVN